MKQSAFLEGAKAAAPFVLVLTPFSMIFGIIAAGYDLNIIEATAYSVFVLAGASQIASMDLLNDGASVFVAVLAGVIINLRMMLYSASLAPYFQGASIKERLLISYALVDQCYVLSQEKFEASPEMSTRERISFFAGIATVILTLWFTMTTIGFVFGNLIPQKFDISFGLPLSFIALIAPSLKSLPHWVAALISVIGALLLHDIPNNGGIFISSLVAILAAAEIERRIKRGQA